MHAIKYVRLILGAVVILAVSEALAGPYVPILNPANPYPGAPIPGPGVVPGKEYSHELDRSSTAIGVLLDAQQNTMWDGSGGVADTFDYDGTDSPTGDQVDALGNWADALFFPVIANQSALLYSLRSGPRIQGQGVDVGAPVQFEAITGATGVWATWAQVDQHGGDNLDALEVWGPEGTDDADKYSLFNDAAVGASVLNYLNPGNSVYITQAELAAAVKAFLNMPSLPDSEIDLDALMVQDVVGSSTVWDNGDYILFSLWPIAPFNIVGDGVIVWQRGAGMNWLNHGGHVWHDGWLGIDVDALEAVSVPEPASLMGVLLGVGLLLRRRRV